MRTGSRRPSPPEVPPTYADWATNRQRTASTVVGLARRVGPVRLTTVDVYRGSSQVTRLDVRLEKTRSPGGTLRLETVCQCKPQVVVWGDSPTARSPVQRAGRTHKSLTRTPAGGCG